MTSKENHDSSRPTPELLEKSMQREHGMTQEEYEEQIEKKVEVEKKREKDHEKNKQLQAEINNQLRK